MNSLKTKLVLGAVLLSAPTMMPEVCQPEVEREPDPCPWKVRLYGANKDRRAARKKRTKKLGRRR